MKTGYDASVLNSADTRIAVVVPNWLGDGIMAMPALQVLREQLNPSAGLDVLARPGQAGLWSMHPSPDEVVKVTFRTSKLLSERHQLHERGYTHVVILPNSFRSALLPALAGIPCRRGTANQLRAPLIHDVVSLSGTEDRHQQWENARILLPGALPAELPPPVLSPGCQPPAEVSEAKRPLLALIPGAARGPSKQWPAERFLEVAQAWTEETGGGTCWLGTPDDVLLCELLAVGCGPDSFSLAGKTSLAEFTAVLQGVEAVVANDSGGMHLAAAVGTPVVAVFGKTDPRKTGPLHPKAVVVQDGGPGDRRIARQDEEARMALEAVTVEQVREPVLAIHRSRG